MQDPSRRAILKARTSTAHDALDKMIGPFDTTASYGRYLQGMAAFRTVVEDMLSLADWPATLPGWQSERLSQLILQDVADTGGRAPAPPLSGACFSRLGAEELLGMLYVLEGSALGARLLYKRAQALGYSEDFGARHLAVQSGQNGRWGLFLRLLDEAECIDIENAAFASVQTFKIAEKAFEGAMYEHA